MDSWSSNLVCVGQSITGLAALNVEKLITLRNDRKDCGGVGSYT